MEQNINDLKAEEIAKLQEDLAIHQQELAKLKAQLGEGTAPTKETLQQIFAEEKSIESEEQQIEDIQEDIADNPENLDNQEALPEQAIEEKRSAWKPKSTGTALYQDEDIAPLVQECLNIMAEKGIFEAVRRAKQISKSHNIAVIDAFHDFIIDKWHDLEAGNYIPKVDL